MSEATTMRIAAVQMACDASREDNLARATDWIAEAAKAGATVVCLPELFTGPYFCQTEDTAAFERAEPVQGPTLTALAGVAREHRIAIVAPFFERRAAGIYHNSAGVLDAAGHFWGLYRKMHIPDDPGFYEKFYFTPGDLGFKTFPIGDTRIGVLICWDQWFPEAARLTAMQGASILFYPTAIGWVPDEKADQGAAQHAAWQTVQRGHAIANGVYVAAVNRIGMEQATQGQGAIEFWGQSFICDPQGQILAEASVDQEEILCVDLDVAQLEAVRRIWPFWRDRRIEAYAGLTDRWHTPGSETGGA